MRQKKPYLSWVKQKIKTARVIDKSIPEGMNLRVLMSLEVKLTDNTRFRQVRNIQAPLELKVNSQIPAKTKIPLLTPMISEIMLPFLKPRKPPNIRKRP